MRIQIDDARLSKKIVRHFRARGYLAVERGPGTIEVVPIDARDEAGDRARTLADLAAWTAANPDVTATPLD
jgi:hypothetical protein